MKALALPSVLLVALLLASTTPASPLPQTTNIPEHHPISQSSNGTTQTFIMARMVMPATANLFLLNNGYLSNSGFAFPGNIDIGYGFLAGAKLMVENDSLVIEPLSHFPVILNPGDNLSVLFGTFHYFTIYPPNQPARGVLVGRFIGVTIEKHL